MRALFLVLLLANILFFAWTRWLAPVPAAAGHPTSSSHDSRAIRLLREVPIAQQQSVAGLGAEPAGLGDAATCVSGGPYTDRAAAELAAARLDALGFTSRLRPSSDAVRTAQWVLIENLATPEDAGNALTTLRTAGIPDAYLLASEPSGNVVSLGVFTDAARSAEVIAIARKAGFTPKVENSYRNEEVFWLDVDRDTNAGLPGLEVFGGEDGRVPRIELRACPAEESVTPEVTAP